MKIFGKTSAIKYLGILSISLAACGDDDKKNNPTDTITDTAQPDADADTTQPDDTTQADTEVTGQPDTTGGTGITTDPNAVATSDVDGHKRTLVNSSSSAHWTHLSFATGALAIPAPEGTDAFHLALQRYLVKLGDGVKVLTLDDVAFADLTAAPAEGDWKIDGETAAISDWWDYNGSTHVLTAKPNRLYVVDTGDAYYKVRFRDYYDQGGSPGYVTIDWAEIDAPAAPVTTKTLELTLSSASFVFANLRTHEALTAAPEAGSLGWDLAVKSVSVQTNSGTSGTGEGGVLELGEGELADFTTLPSGATFTADASFPIAGPPGSGDESRNGVLDSFYTYNPTTHVITVNPKVFAVKLADGAIVKLKFLTWSSTSISFEYAPLEGAGE